MPASTAALSFNQARKVYPYLLRDLVIDHPNHVWATDVTYIPIARGFAYLVDGGALGAQRFYPAGIRVESPRSSVAKTYLPTGSGTGWPCMVSTPGKSPI